MPKRTVRETIEYFEQLASEFEKKSHREQDELTKAQYAAKAEAYELAAPCRVLHRRAGSEHQHQEPQQQSTGKRGEVVQPGKYVK